MIIALAVLAVIQAATLTDNTPVLCTGDNGFKHPLHYGRPGKLKPLTFGALAAVFKRKFGFDVEVVPINVTERLLVFRSPNNGAETVSYAIGEAADPPALFSMTVRTRAGRQSFIMEDVCRRTLAIVNAR